MRIAKPGALLSAFLLWGVSCVDTPVPPPTLMTAEEWVFPETVVLGGADAVGPSAFGRVSAVALLATEDRIIVADGQTQELLVFAVDGTHLRTLGGRGGGPGEFQAIRQIRARPDGGFCVWDVQTTRVTRFDGQAEVTSSSHADLDDLEHVRPAFHGFLDDCSFVLRDERFVTGMRDEPEGIRQDTVRFELFGPDGVRLGTIARRQNAERWFRNRDGTWGYTELIFGESLFGFPMDGGFWVGTSDAPRWVRLSLTGDTVDVFSLPHRPRPVAPSEIAAERARRIGNEDGSSRSLAPPEIADRLATSRRAAIEEVAARPTLPAYDAVARGPDGALWVRQYPLPNDVMTTWLLADTTATWAGRVTIPRGDSLVVASRRTLVSLGRDSVDAPVIRLRRR